MKLLPFQVEFLQNAFADDCKGGRKVSTAILSMPKAGGKTTLTACICLAFLVGPFAAERNEVYAASISQKKAGILYEEMKHIILRVPEFAAVINPHDADWKFTVTSGDGLDSKFECLSADASGASGLAPVFWCYDEAGEAPDGRLLSVLLESEGKTDETLGVVLSTQADSDDHPFSRLIDTAPENESMYCQLHTAPMEADAFSDETLKLANPSWGSFLDLKAIKKSRDRARSNSSLEPGYRRYRLNQRVDAQSELRLVGANIWKECAGPVDAKNLRNKLKGKTCYGGLDLSTAARGDLTSLVLAFPDDKRPEPGYDVLCWNWTPSEGLKSRKPAELERFKEWVAGEYINVIEGKVIRTSSVAKDIAAILEEYDVRTISYDNHRFEELKEDLEAIDVEMPAQEFRQGFTPTMGPAIEFVQELCTTGRIRHGSNPVLNASVVNAVVTPSKEMMLKLDKPKSNKRGPVRIDPAICLIMALYTAKRFKEEKKPTLEGFIKAPVMVI
jgi:phage terminase large subunit-like protein